MNCNKRLFNVTFIILNIFYSERTEKDDLNYNSLYDKKLKACIKQRTYYKLNIYRSVMKVYLYNR